jgi:predicted SPOUT superfamily RNA methylase MTH1
VLPFHAALLLPSSLTEQEPDARIRTYKVGQVGRAAALFGVREIVVYTEATFNDARFLETVLRYQECPPYLRKRLFKLAPELSHAGVLPPLNTPAHLAGREAKVGDVREAVATRTGVEMGTSKPGKSLRPLPEGERVTVRIVGDLGREYVVTRHDDPAHSAGYQVRRADSLAQALQGYDARIMTSRAGEPAAKVPAYKMRGRVALAFGPPGLSVEEVLQREGAQVKWDFVLNAAPRQGTETVRTEEAVLASLAALAAVVG